MTMRSLFDGALTMILYVLAFAAGTVFVRANYDLIEAHPLLVFFVGAIFAYQAQSARSCDFGQVEERTLNA